MRSNKSEAPKFKKIDTTAHSMTNTQQTRNQKSAQHILNESSDEEPPSYLDVAATSSHGTYQRSRTRKPMAAMNDSSLLGANLEDGATGLPSEAFVPVKPSSVEQGQDPKPRTRKVIKKKKKGTKSGLAAATE